LIEMTPLLVVAGLTGCATYHPEPLPRRTDLAAGLAGLDLNVPATGDPDPSRMIDLAQPLTIDQIGLLAMLNNPDLKSERGTLDVARVALLQATLLPDPTAKLVYVPSWSPAPGTAALDRRLAGAGHRGARDPRDPASKLRRPISAP
jgi:hypothetical protein